jgi:uncharacterized RDD family membrane protein YckC
MIPDNYRPINAGLRLATMVLDHVFMCFIGMFFYLPMFITIFATSFKSTHEPDDFNFMGGPLLYIGVFGICLYFCKDIINGRSIAKRILKLQIVDNKTGEVASPLQCFVRDLFCIIWPVEFIVAMANTGRRIGDRIAGTRLVYYDPAIHKIKPNIGRIILPIILTIGLTVLLAQIMPSPEFNKTTYSKTSYNHPESKALEQLISDSLGEYVMPEIKIYDTVTNSNLKYISAVIRLRENYLEDDKSYRQLHEMTTDLIYQQFPRESFTGQIRYVFRGPGQFQSKSTSIGSGTLNP